VHTAIDPRTAVLNVDFLYITLLERAHAQEHRLCTYKTAPPAGFVNLVRMLYFFGINPMRIALIQRRILDRAFIAVLPGMLRDVWDTHGTIICRLIQTPRPKTITCFFLARRSGKTYALSAFTGAFMVANPARSIVVIGAKQPNADNVIRLIKIWIHALPNGDKYFQSRPAASRITVCAQGAAIDLQARTEGHIGITAVTWAVAISGAFTAIDTAKGLGEQGLVFVEEGALVDARFQQEVIDPYRKTRGVTVLEITSPRGGENHLTIASKRINPETGEPYYDVINMPVRCPTCRAADAEECVSRGFLRSPWLWLETQRELKGLKEDDPALYALEVLGESRDRRYASYPAMLLAPVFETPPVETRNLDIPIIIVGIDPSGGSPPVEAMDGHHAKTGSEFAIVSIGYAQKQVLGTASTSSTGTPWPSFKSCPARPAWVVRVACVIDSIVTSFLQETRHSAKVDHRVFPPSLYTQHTFLETPSLLHGGAKRKRGHWYRAFGC
jgi:hypothetical protein